MARAGQSRDAARAASDLAAANYMAPAIRAFAAAANVLPDAVERVCETGDDGTREVLQAALRETVRRWAGLEVLRLGTPGTAQGMQHIQGNRHMQPWWRVAPAGAPNGLPHRDVATVIARGDIADLAPDRFVRLPAAAQGLGALDVLISDRRAPLAPGHAARFRCAYAQSVAERLATFAADDGRTKARGPAGDARALLAGLIDGLKAVRADVGQMRVRPAFVAPSLTRAYYAARVAVLEALYEAMDLEAMLPDSKDWVKNRANTAWRTLKASDGAGGRGDGVGKGEAPTVQAVLESCDVLSALIADEIAVEFGLTRRADVGSRNATR